MPIRPDVVRDERESMRYAMAPRVVPASAPARQDEWRQADEHLASLLDPSSWEADRYRILRQLVERKHATKRLIALTSALAGDGKTTTAINLAGALSQAPDTRILLSDLDLRTPSVGDRLGLVSQSPGLVDLILDPTLALGDVVRRHPRFRLEVLPAGRPLAVPYELLKSPRLEELFQEMRQRYDYVVLDTPPLVPVPDSRLIADQVDSLVMVVTAHRTPRALLEDALNQMEPAKVIGIVFNRDDHPVQGYYGYSYHGDGDGHYHGHGRRSGRQARDAWTSLLEKIRRVFVG